MGETHTLTVAAGNEQQAAAWEGDEGEFWAAHASRFDDSIAGHHEALLSALEIRSDTRALDVGCGTGLVARDIARRASRGSVLGVDLGARMLEVARSVAANQGLGNLDFEQADAQIHPFPGSAYDLVVARTSAMFFADKPAAFANLVRAMRPGGQLALLVWQEPGRNEWFTALTSALAAGRELPAPPPEGPHPFSMADPAATRRLLERAGLHAVHVEQVEEPMWFGDDADDAFAFVRDMLGWMITEVDDATRARALAALRETVERHETAQGVVFGSGAWLVTARR
jgi:SAM-dependent methyltransferase